MQKVALYIRVSTEEQKVHGLSLEAQKDALIDYAAKHHMCIVGTYVDAGVTARKRLGHRKELNRLLSDVEKGCIDLIIFTKLDRWFRNIADYYKVQEVLERNQVNWKTIFESYDTSTANGRLHINIMLSIAQDEADRTSERIKAVFESKRARGETPASMAPLGYKIINSKLLVNDETKQVAIDIFHYYDMHHSIAGCQRMARELHGCNIYEYTIRRMFDNTIYIGEFKGISGFNEPLISHQQFERIKKYREVRVFKNQLAAGRVYLFSTLLQCKECGHTLSAMYNINHNQYGDKEFHYYRCNQAVSTKKCPHIKRMNEQKLEQVLLEKLIQDLNKQMFHIESFHCEKKNRLNTTKLVNRLEKLKELYLDNLIDKDSYRIEYESITKQLQKSCITHSVNSIQKEFSDSNFIDLYNNFNPEEKKTFWLGIVDKIIVDKHLNIEVHFL
ncbi:recombinase family protein [Anaeromicropila populeti]|uniref:Site-specific DNA recombinase n=1 Tax=Anaeromicropila populeti TaxID=37658 RepID=A0A1I6JDR2_9FIRM|nr:recombinase family protein [Anaeromicropila populeti]SFR77173.1 Site-specific DNA recombinase [Anaeromicropila populeti]